MKFRNKSILIVGFAIIFSFSLLAFFISDKIEKSVRRMSTDLCISYAKNSSAIVLNEIEKYIYMSSILHDLLQTGIQGNEISESIISKTLINNISSSSEHDGSWYIENSNFKNSDFKKLHSFYYHKHDSIIIKDSVNAYHHSFLEKIINVKGFKSSEPYLNNEGRYIISILSPVIKNNELYGLLGFDIDLLSFQKHFYNEKALGQAYVGVMSAKGICVSHPDQKRIGTKLNSFEHYASISKEKKQDIHVEKEVFSEFLQLKVLRIYKQLSITDVGGDWLMVSSVPAFNIQDVVSEVLGLVAWIGFLSAFLLMIFLYYSQNKWRSEWLMRKKAESGKKDAVNKLSSIIEGSSEIMIFSVDRKGLYTAYNSYHYKAILSSQQSTISIGSKYIDSFEGEFREKMSTHIKRALTGNHFIVEYKKGGQYYQQTFNAILNDKYEVIGVSSIRFDISETVFLRQKAVDEKQARIQIQLKSLKNQVNPHFLFNSLNSLYALVVEEPNLAREFVIRLSKVYRYLLDSNKRNLVSLKEELEFANHYLFLQKIRFGDNLICNINVDQKYLSMQVPSVSIQSLLENAIKHNIITNAKPLVISICIDNNSVLVENNYQLRNNDNLSVGTGLKNLSAQYKYINGSSISFGMRDGKYRVLLPLLNP